MIEDNSTVSIFQKAEIPDSEWYTNDPTEGEEGDQSKPIEISVKVEPQLNSKKTKILDELGAPATFTTVDYVLFDTKKPSDALTVDRLLNSADWKSFGQFGLILRPMRAKAARVCNICSVGTDS